MVKKISRRKESHIAAQTLFKRRPVSPYSMAATNEWIPANLLPLHLGLEPFVSVCARNIFHPVASRTRRLNGHLSPFTESAAHFRDSGRSVWPRPSIHGRSECRFPFRRGCTETLDVWTGRNSVGGGRGHRTTPGHRWSTGQWKRGPPRHISGGIPAT